MPQAKKKKSGRVTPSKTKEEPLDLNSLLEFIPQAAAPPEGAQEIAIDPNFFIEALREQVAIANANAAQWQAIARTREAQLKGLHGEYVKLKQELERLIGERHGKDKSEGGDEDEGGERVESRRHGSGKQSSKRQRAS